MLDEFISFTTVTTLAQLLWYINNHYTLAHNTSSTKTLTQYHKHRPLSTVYNVHTTPTCQVIRGGGYSPPSVSCIEGTGGEQSYAPAVPRPSC